MPVLRAGAASTNITPPVGLDMEGYLREGPSAGVLDELTCQAVVFDDGETRLVLAVADLIGISRRLRQRVCAGIDLPPEQVMLTATHTHCGPGHLAREGHEDLLAQLADGILRAVAAAEHALQPAALIAGAVEAGGLAANRRDPEGPVDHTATFLAAFPLAGIADEAVATIVNFACHPTILDAKTLSYSADFPGAARHAIGTLCGGHGVYLQGAAGDINPVHTEPSPAEARRTGAILGAAVAREVLASARALGSPRVINPSLDAARIVTGPVSGRLIEPAPLRACLADVAVEPKSHPPLPAIRAARAAATDPARQTELALEEYIASQTGFDSFDFPGSSPTLPVQAFRLGAGLTVAGLPGEPFTATGQQIRAASPGTVLLAGYANQAAGYLPPRDEFGRGGLEVGCSTHAPGTAERLEAEAVNLLRRVLYGRGRAPPSLLPGQDAGAKADQRDDLGDLGCDVVQVSPGTGRLRPGQHLVGTPGQAAADHPGLRDEQNVGGGHESEVRR